MSGRHVYRHAIATQSLEAIAEHLANTSSLVVALRFLERAEEALAAILQSPGIGRLRNFRSGRLAGVRTWHVRGFRN